MNDASLTAIAASGDLGGNGPWREGKLLVARDQSIFPPRCPTCGGPSVGLPVVVRIIRIRREGAVASPIGDLLERAIGYRYTGPITIKVYFCAKHRRARRTLIAALIAFVILGGAGTEACWLIDPKNGLSGAFFFPSLFAVGGALALAVVIRGANPWLDAKRFVDRYVWLRGACTGFLDSLPTFDNAVQRSATRPATSDVPRYG